MDIYYHCWRKCQPVTNGISILVLLVDEFLMQCHYAISSNQQTADAKCMGRADSKIGMPETASIYEMGLLAGVVTIRVVVAWADSVLSTRYGGIQNNCLNRWSSNNAAAMACYDPTMPRQPFTPGTTTWHITWGAYGTRLHGDSRPTVDKQHNERGTPFVGPDRGRRDAEHGRMKYPPVRLTREQCLFIQTKIPAICERGGWGLRVCAAAADHVHVLLDIETHIHGQKVRRLLKRWISEALNEAWAPGSGRPGSLPEGGRWWAEEGSNKPVKDVKYLNNAFNYIDKQRMT